MSDPGPTCSLPAPGPTVSCAGPAERDGAHGGSAGSRDRIALLFATRPERSVTDIDGPSAQAGGSNHDQNRQGLHRERRQGRSREQCPISAPCGEPGNEVGRYQELTGSTTLDFDRRIDPYRSELLAHCYRMLGSVHDAEDLVQETYLRAWRAREQYDEDKASIRTWLYRIATNACLTALDGRSRRPLPSGLVEPSDPTRPLVFGADISWLQPFPDARLDATDPAAALAAQGSLRLAFVAAMQVLSARQRAALVLRDVLDFSAAETAQILGTTTAAVNSALQRARSRLTEAGVSEARIEEPPEAERRALVDRYVEAFLKADVAAIKQLLTDDVLMEMPPMVNWFVGREAYGQFMEWVFAKGGSDWRMLPVWANAQPAVAAYVRGAGGVYELHTLQVFAVTAAGISRTSVFQDAEVFAVFGLAPQLPD